MEFAQSPKLFLALFVLWTPTVEAGNPTSNPLLDKDFVIRSTAAEFQDVIENGWDINGRREPSLGILGESTLHVVVRHGTLDKLEMLLKAGANVDLQDSGGNSALHTAAEHGTLEMIRLLVKAGAKVDLKGTTVLGELSDPPLHVAARRGEPQIIKALVDSSADVNATDNRDWTPLHVAAMRHNNIEGAKILIRSGADVDALNDIDQTALHIAAYFGDPEMIDILLDAGAEPDLVDRNGETPKELAATNPRISGNRTSDGGRSYRRLQGDDTVLQDTHNALLDKTFVKTSSPEAYRREVNSRKDLAARDESGNTAMHLAAGYGSARKIEMLVKLNADVNARSKQLWTPLHYAALSASRKEVTVLIKAGADIEARDDGGQTPLFKAVMNPRRNEENTKLLLSANANVQVKDIEGRTPLHYASEVSAINTIKALLAKGARANMADESGQYPSDYAEENSNFTGWHRELYERLVRESKRRDVSD